MGIHDFTNVFDDAGSGQPLHATVEEFALRSYAPIGIDASYYIQRAIKAMASVTALSHEGKPTAHIKNVLDAVIRYYETSIITVWVFDGEPTDHKALTLARREKIRADAEHLMDHNGAVPATPAAVVATDFFSDDFTGELDQQAINGLGSAMRSKAVDADRLGKQAFKLTDDLVQPIKDLLTIMGVPWIQAKHEADFVLAKLAKTGMIRSVISADADMLVFGIPVLIKPVSQKVSKNKRLFEVYSLEKILAKNQLSMDSFIKACVALGCDYAEKVKGVGPKSVLSAIQKGITFNEAQLAAYELFINPPAGECKVIINADHVKEGNTAALVEFLLKYGFTKADDYAKKINDKHINYDLLIVNLKTAIDDHQKRLAAR
jgi:5'-3' exonuclease